ncbi:hypothetical protein V5O48_003214 [Marasmius crinis-equi]|uniref:Uncharacterized protein n=1 Tax=Marasmius crinis-equi TaxID=585013 RepID=A0ABR3FUB5_9AGAR
MPQVNKFSAWITVDGKSLQEYDVQVDETTNTVTCWIASEPGKSAGAITNIARRPQAGYESMAMVVAERRYRLKLHDRRAAGKVLPRLLRLVYLLLSPRLTHPLPILVLVQDDNSLLSLSDPAAPNVDIGTIKISIKNVRVLGTEFTRKSYRPPPPSKIFHEQTKKMVEHQTRPLATLQAQDIAPRPQPPPRRLPPSPPHPNPQPSTSGIHGRLELGSDREQTIHSDDDEAKQIEDLQRQLDTLRKRRNREDRGHGSPAKKVKREPIVGLTIDLTED